MKEELKRLKTQLGIDEVNRSQTSENFTSGEALTGHNVVSEYLPASEPELFDQEIEVHTSPSIETINKRSTPLAKVRVFMSLFRGRDDVFAKRWENKVKGTAGYSPACGKEWKPGICQKPKIKCSECKHQDFLPMNEMAVEAHLRGQQNLIAGIYPMLCDETCWFLAIDFDDEGWQKDITVLREVCTSFEIPVTVERSRSGNGAHAWFFFEHPVPATLARKFGSAILTFAMNKRHEITFKSYDRFFRTRIPCRKVGSVI